MCPVSPFYVDHLFFLPGFACLLLSASSEFSISDKYLWVDIYEQKRVNKSLEWGWPFPLNRLTMDTQKCTSWAGSGTGKRLIAILNQLQDLQGNAVLTVAEKHTQSSRNSEWKRLIMLQRYLFSLPSCLWSDNCNGPAPSFDKPNPNPQLWEFIWASGVCIYSYSQDSKLLQLYQKMVIQGSH